MLGATSVQDPTDGNQPFSTTSATAYFLAHCRSFGHRGLDHRSINSAEVTFAILVDLQRGGVHHDIKKQKYIYYRCSRHKGNCKAPYVRQEKLLEQFVDTVARVCISTTSMASSRKRSLRESPKTIAGI
ncbi:zinc ribbon domain-containing protein [Sphingopyxis sp.]|uniref:zinc ribbon domain-containing protein n=1 Tax=Sphingopyxis sp. TaxID=1908224 RepID=UPI003D0D8AD0